MPLDIIVGTQWGDEGKGRVVDLLSSKADFVARYSGGDNAGHTVTVGSRTFKLHLIPSGLVYPHTIGVIGNGLVVNPSILLSEMDSLRKSGLEINPKRLAISYAAHIITPAHLALDSAQENARGKEKIGTTLRGIGPAYTEKISRRGLRFELMLDTSKLQSAIARHVETINHMLVNLYHAEPLNPQRIFDEFLDYAGQLKPYIKDVSSLLASALASGKKVLAEGAQGTLLDIDHGTYPFVTSSNPTAPGALVGLGLGLAGVERVVGVTKAFQTRVGEGPFPTEVFDETAKRLRGTGENPWDEFGTTTGRPRRVGWLDFVLLRYATRVNGLTELTITKLDILSGLKEIKLCTAYQDGDKLYHELPYGPSNLNHYRPVFEVIPGWEQDICQTRNWEELPQQARAYILKIEELTGIPVRLVSVGPERQQVIETN